MLPPDVRSGRRRGPERWRPAVSVGMAAAAVLLVPVLLGRLGSAGVATVEAHSQLVSTIPGDGEILDRPPSGIRLVFSEALAPGYTSVQVADAGGQVVVPLTGAVDAADDHVLDAEIGPLGPGSYAVTWYALSSDDGHVTQGSFAFTISGAAGNLSPAPSSSAPASGGGGATRLPPASTDTLHAGHDSGQAAVEVQGKTLGYGGLMLAFGLPLVAWFVLRPAMAGRPPRVFVQRAAIANLAAALGAGLLVIVGVASLPTTASGSPPDGGAFVFGSRPGQLLLVRFVLGAAAGTVALAIGRRRASASLAVSSLAGGVGIALAAVSGHAVAFESPVPVLVDLVHIGAAGVWLSGLVSLAALSDFGGRFDPPTLRDVVPRYSAVAVVSIALTAAAGLYAAWIQTRDIVSTATGYAINLDIKLVLVGFALVIGAVNFIDAGRDLRVLGGLSRRILLETALAVGIVVVTANLTSGSPSAEDRPVALAPEQTTAAEAQIDLAVQPGRPGTNRFIASSGGAPAPAGSTVTLVLRRSDGSGTEVRLPMRPRSTSPGQASYAADTSALTADSRWAAAVVVSGPDGTVSGSRSFAFVLDRDGIAAGRLAPPVDPVVAIGILAGLAGLAGLGLALSGRSIPRTPPAWGRRVLLAGSSAGTALGVLILAGGSIR